MILKLFSNKSQLDGSDRLEYLIGNSNDRNLSKEAETNTHARTTGSAVIDADDLLTFALFGKDEPTLPKEKLDEIRRYAEYIKNK